MKLRLVETGGVTGIRRASEREFDISGEEKVAFKSHLSISSKSPSARDMLAYTLIIDEGEHLHIDPNSTRGEWKEIIEKMKEGLEPF